MKGKSQKVEDPPIGGSTGQSAGSNNHSDNSQDDQKPLSDKVGVVSYSSPASNSDGSVKDGRGGGGKRSRDHLTANPNPSATPPSQRERILKKSVSWNSGDQEETIPTPNLADSGENS